MKKMDLEWLNIAPLIPDYKDEITADIRKCMQTALSPPRRSI